MTLRLYLDVHVPVAVANELRARGVDVLRAQDDGFGRASDSELLDRATALGHVLVSQDVDLIEEATRRTREGITFGGVIFAAQRQITIGQMVTDLEIVATAGSPEDLDGQLLFLPLRG